MKSTIVKLLLSTMIFFVAGVVSAADHYTLDPMHTYAQWHVNHFGFSNSSGKWMAEGSLDLDESHPENSKVQVLIHIDTLNTGLPELDKHLKGPLFFDVAQFRIATFTSNKVILTSKNRAKVQGTLMLHGISKPVSFDVLLNKKGINPISDKMTVGFSGDAILHRSDFDITTLLPGISDEVHLHVETEAYK